MIDCRILLRPLSQVSRTFVVRRSTSASSGRRLARPACQVRWPAHRARDSYSAVTQQHSNTFCLQLRSNSEVLLAAGRVERDLLAAPFLCTTFLFRGWTLESLVP